MRARIPSILLVLVGLLASGSGPAKEGPWILVHKIACKAVKVDKKRLEAGAAALEAALADGGAFRIVPKDVIGQRIKELEAMLRAGHLKTPRGLTKECAENAAREIFSDLELETVVARGKKAGSCAVTASATGLFYPDQKTQAKAEGPCSQVGLVKSMQSVAGQLRSWVDQKWEKNDDPAPLENEEIVAKMKEHLDDIKACHDKNPLPEALSHGKFILEVTVLPDGRVGRVELKTDEFKGQKVVKCATEVIEKLKFRVFSGPVKTMRFPFQN